MYINIYIYIYIYIYTYLYIHIYIYMTVRCDSLYASSTRRWPNQPAPTDPTC